jgi:hypothetical protein
MDVFLRCLQEGPLDSTHPLFFLSLERTAVRICENLRKFLSMILRQILLQSTDFRKISYKLFGWFPIIFRGWLWNLYAFRILAYQ